MKKNVLFFAAIFFLLALVSCNKANPSSEEGTIAQETTLKAVIVGIPNSDSSDLKEITDTFSVDQEKVALRAYWNPRKEGYNAEYLWINPEGKVAYSKKMEMKPEWKRSLVYYRGPKPMAAGNWRLDVMVNGKLYGKTTFTVVRERSKVPLVAQIEAFNSEKITLEEAQLLADKIRCFANKKCTAEEAVSAVSACAAVLPGHRRSSRRGRERDGCRRAGCRRRPRGAADGGVFCHACGRVRPQGSPAVSGRRRRRISDS